MGRANACEQALQGFPEIGDERFCFGILSR